MNSHGMHRFTGAAATLVFLASVARAVQVSVEHDPGRAGSTYTLREGDCRTQWSLVPGVSGGFVILNYSACPKPLAEQRPMLSKILGAILKQGTPKSFSWGRLTPDEPKDDLAMAYRLALAAHHSARWDVTRGRPRAGDINRFVIQLANESEIYPELRELFRQFNLTLTLTDGEKVLVFNAAKLPFYDRLRAAGVKASEKLPFDFQAYFTVSPLVSDLRN
jgi:hypothetical protein